MSTSKSPNILVVVTDQQRADLIGALGVAPVKTPALDRLCAEGTCYSRTYTPCPICTPTRASLLTGQYPSRHGAWSVGTDTPDDALSLPRLLSEEVGYRTAIIGKSHLKNCLHEDSFEALPRSRDWEFFQQWTGPWFGFDYAKICVGHVYEPHAYCMHYGLWLREKGIPPEPPYFNEKGKGNGCYDAAGRWQLPEKYHSSHWVADETIAYLKDHVAHYSDRPFYLSINFPDPHVPFAVPEPWNQMYDGEELPPPVRRIGEWEDKTTFYQAALEKRINSLNWHDQVSLPGQGGMKDKPALRSPEEETNWRIYMGMQSLVDHHFGRILDELDRLKLAKDTIVVFTSDHGDYMGDHFLWGKGGIHYDAAIRVPFIVRWPGNVPEGERSSSLQSLVDLPVTLMAAAGLSAHPQMQGINQLPAWFDSNRSVRSGVLIDHRVEQGIYVNSWVTDQYRLSVHSILAEQRDEIELYDLANDPHEFRNLAFAGQNQDLASELLQQLIRFRMTISGPWQKRLSYA